MSDIPLKDQTVLVVGGGVAGMMAAYDLAGAGGVVHLLEKGVSLGGQVENLDKLYPTDHCAFCPLWTEVRRVQMHPGIHVHTLSRITGLEPREGGLLARIAAEPSLIDPRRCIFCGRCVPVCPEGAIVPLSAHVYPPAYRIDRAVCSGCGECLGVCPTGAIDLEVPPRELTLQVSDVIWATGLMDADIHPLEEYGYGTHADIMSALEFEDWISEAGPAEGAVLTHAGDSPGRIAFVQCAGARDRRLFPYCSAVCCMHALKQAQWVKRRCPGTECVIFYTDLRTEGRHYYEYYLRQSENLDLRLVRGRPGLIHPLSGGGIAVRYEDTLAQQRRMERFDMVVLNGALKPSLAAPDAGGYAPPLGGEGFVASGHACGFCREPGDVELSVIQAASAALKVCLGGDHGQ